MQLIFSRGSASQFAANLTCRYRLSSSPDGNQTDAVRWSSPADIPVLYHIWTCEGAEGMLCMTIYNCTLKNKADPSKSVRIVDERGCSLDTTYLQGEIKYKSDLSAVAVTSSSFPSFLSTNSSSNGVSLSFSCQTHMGLKFSGICKRTSDNCSATNSTTTPSAAGKRRRRRRRNSPGLVVETGVLFQNNEV